MARTCSDHENDLDSSLLFFYNENLYLWEKPEDVNLVDKFLSKGKMTISQIRLARTIAAIYSAAYKRISC